MMNRSRFAIATLFLAACLSPPVETPKTNVEEEIAVRVEQGYENQVDILFVIDNSNSMEPKQRQLRRRIPALITELNRLRDEGLPAHYHIGVVTSDMGAAPYADQYCVPGGDEYGGGRMRFVAEAADPRCTATKNGLQFLDVNQLDGTSNLPDVPAGEPADPLAWAFGCMAAVGDKGCGFEQHLEAAYAALHNPDNQGFLRKEALLVVVIVADEDDCSGAPGSDLFDKGVASNGQLNSFRCSNYGLFCDGQLLPYGVSPGAYQTCRPATAADGGKLRDVSRYIDYLTKQAPDSAKQDPANKVILTAIAAPTAGGITTVLATDKKGADGQAIPCSGPLGLNCFYQVTKSCVSKTDSTFSGDAAVRLEAVVNASPLHQFTSICDDDYSPALEGIAKQIERSLKPGCIHGVLERPEHPDCVVEQLDKDGAITTLPFCADAAAPCWKIEENAECAPSLKAIAIDRGGQVPPVGSYTRAACASVAQLRTPTTSAN